jgi:hypothetical protein
MADEGQSSLFVTPGFSLGRRLLGVIKSSARRNAFMVVPFQIDSSSILHSSDDSAFYGRTTTTPHSVS